MDIDENMEDEFTGSMKEQTKTDSPFTNAYNTFQKQSGCEGSELLNTDEWLNKLSFKIFLRIVDLQPAVSYIFVWPSTNLINN